MVQCNGIRRRRQGAVQLGSIVGKRRVILRGGLFAIQEKNGKQRLIFDKRPQNTIEKRRAWIRLPAGSQLAQIVLAPQRVLRGSGEDLSNFYFYVRHLSHKWP